MCKYKASYNDGHFLPSHNPERRILLFWIALVGLRTVIMTHQPPYYPLLSKRNSPNPEDAERKRLKQR